MHERAIASLTDDQTSVLGSLRALLPNRRLSLTEALRIAELQADRLLRLRGIDDPAVPVEVVTDLPRITLDYDPDLPRHAASERSAHHRTLHTRQDCPVANWAVPPWARSGRHGSGRGDGGGGPRAGHRGR